jgi:2'-hydroxyisoflavone reductase
MHRRELLKAGAAAGLATLLGRASGLAAASTAAPRPLRILILGGTGFTGPHQVRYALARGHRITLFNRGRRPQDWPAGVEELTGDRDTGDLKSLAGREWDVCIDNPTSVPFWVRDAGRVLAGRVKHYVFISTLSVYADNATPGADETAATLRYAGRDAMAETRSTLRADMGLYGPLKAECEREAEKWFPGITTIIRPTLIVGPGDETDRFTYWPVRLARGGEVLAPPAEDPVQIIDARDLAEWTIRVAEQRAIGVFNAAGPREELRVEAMVNGIAGALGADAKLVFATNDFLRAQGIAPWADLPAWVPGQGETAGFARVGIARAVAAGLTYRPLGETAKDTFAWFNAQPAERRAKLRAGLSPEREAAALKAWAARA